MKPQLMCNYHSALPRARNILTNPKLEKPTPFPKTAQHRLTPRQSVIRCFRGFRFARLRDQSGFGSLRGLDPKLLSISRESRRVGFCDPQTVSCVVYLHYQQLWGARTVAGLRTWQMLKEERDCDGVCRECPGSRV